jgi:glutamate synthase (ferredoxin)
MFYFSSLSTPLLYINILMPEDISRYYTDLTDDDLVTRLALVHQRFSTNTFPSWELAQFDTCVTMEKSIPFVNVSRMRAREELMESDVFGDDIKNYSHYWMENQTPLLWIWLSNYY